MSAIIKSLSNEYEESYTDFVLSKKESLMYYSLQFRKFLSELLGDESEYLIAVDNDKVVGCLPIFFRKDPKNGVVANSLPYYGGHGGPLAEDVDIMEKLLKKYVEVVSEKKCVASTIVGSPLEDFDSVYKEILRPDYIDERIELMTYFPYSDDLQNAESLMKAFHYKERNSIRKAIKNGVEVEIDNSDEAFDFLHDVHTDNMLAVGGIPKTNECFEGIRKNFKVRKEYNLYVAKINGVKVAALLVLYFNGTVEYYTPAIVEEYRSVQPLAHIIYTAMQDAMDEKNEKWNWGGTGLTQKSLYDFKSKWGTTESRYYYYTKIWDKSIINIQRDELGSIYKNYYVYPFNQVNNG